VKLINPKSGLGLLGTQGVDKRSTTSLTLTLGILLWALELFLEKQSQQAIQRFNVPAETLARSIIGTPQLQNLIFDTDFDIPIFIISTTCAGGSGDRQWLTLPRFRQLPVCSLQSKQNSWTQRKNV
jgi:hypothetical protein